MTPPQKSRHGGEAARRWRTAAPPAPLLKRTGGAPLPWPTHHQPHPTGQIHRTHCLPPHLPLFHTRHAEESAERPHLVTVVCPCGQSALRKVTVLLNRRGVVSFEQLLLDISEALGFPRWHRARVTRLYTTYAREVKGVCDFFGGDMAFLALGKARPELSSVEEALEELFPDHCQYRAEALLVWEKKLRPAPDKAAKADSGYSEGRDSSGTHSNKDTHHHADAKDAANQHTARPADAHQPKNGNAGAQKSHKKNACRKPALLPNNLQRVHVSGGSRDPQPSLIGPFKHEELFRGVDVRSPTLCENCLARQAKHQAPEWINPLSGRVPLPPVSRKQKECSPVEKEGRTSNTPQQIGSNEERSPPQLQHLNPLPGVGAVQENIQERTTFDLPSDGSEVTLSDIERFYEIGRVVGDGNFAVVRECRRRDTSKPLAVKIVERSKLIGREHMMQNELSLLGSLCHPRIVRLFAHHHTHTHSYLVMELVSGGDLFEAIGERGKFPETEAGLMVSDVSEALTYIHCKRIVHRDVKPENLLMEHVADGVSRLKLGDFGLAMVVTEPVFTVCGTPTYVAPEILLETGYGLEVDVWALGVILYILLCGFPPFRSRDRDQEELFEIIKQGQLEFLPPYWDPISEEGKCLVRALLQSDPTVRMTAEQTLLHPWVKAMASICRQGALTYKSERSTETAGEEAGRMQGAAHTSAAEAVTHKRPGDTCNSGGSTDLGGHNRGRDEMSAGVPDENKPPQQPSVEASAVRTVPSVASPGQQEPHCTSRSLHSRQVMQDVGQKVSSADWEPVNPASSARDEPAAQEDSPSATGQSTQISPKQMQDSFPPTNEEPQVTASRSPQNHQPSNQVSAQRQNLTSGVDHPTTEATAPNQQAEKQ